MLETWSTSPRAEEQLIADCLVRLAIGHAALATGSPRPTAARSARILGPHIDGLLGGERIW